MSAKKFTPLFLAASVLLTGYTGGILYSPQAANAITSVDELSDVDSSQWAFDALKDLVEKYNVVEGYPDRTFRGKQSATRFEMAAALNALIKYMGKDIARLGTEVANKADMDMVAKLQDELKAELATLNARASALEERATKIEAKNDEQDNRLDVLEKLKIYGDLTIGAFADIGGRGGDGTPLGAQAPKAPITEGQSDGISALGALRLNVDYPVVEGNGEGIGEGWVKTQMVGSIGRVSPLLSGADAGKTGTGAGQLTGTTYLTGLGAASGRTGNDTSPDLIIRSAYYTQSFGSGVPLLTDLLGMDLMPDDDNWRTSFDFSAGLRRWADEFDKSPSRDEINKFQNTAFITNQAIAVSSVNPMLSAHWHQGLGEWFSADLKAAIQSITPADMAGSLAYTYEGNVNYNLGFLSDYLNAPGNVYVGGFVANLRGGSNGLIQGTTGIGGKTIGNIESFLNAWQLNPGGVLQYTNVAPGGVRSFPAAAGGRYAGTVPVDLGISPAYAGTFGLGAAAFISPATLASTLGIPVGRLNDPTVILPISAVAAINARNLAVGMPIQYNTSMPLTLGAYIANQFAALGIPTAAGALPTSAQGNGFGQVDANDNVKGIYLGWNQRLYKGIEAFFSYANQDTGPATAILSGMQSGTGRNNIFAGFSGAYTPGADIFGVQSSWTTGFTVPVSALPEWMTWGKRQKDEFGFGYAEVKPISSVGSTYAGSLGSLGAVGTSNTLVFTPVTPSVGTIGIKKANEKIFEMYYKMQVTDNVTITPSMQVILDRLGDRTNDAEFVLGLRSTFSFH